MSPPLVIVKIVEGKAELRCFRARGGNWIAVADSLGLTIQASTWAELMEDTAQTLNAMLGDLMASGELERFLRDRGWRPEGQVPTRPAEVWFDVPFVTRTVDRDSEAALR